MPILNDEYVPPMKVIVYTSNHSIMLRSAVFTGETVKVYVLWIPIDNS